MGYQDIKFPEDTIFLVTGAAGFIGSNLVEAILRLGYKVRDLTTSQLRKKTYKSFWVIPFLSL